MLNGSVWPGFAERAVLVLNHLLRTQMRTKTAASDRLLAHAGKTVHIDWRSSEGRWPQPPAVTLRITPAGLFEIAPDHEVGRAESEAAIPGLHITVDLPGPLTLARMLAQAQRPATRIEGDTQLAADIAWLAEHLRWDAEHDLAQLFGDLPARSLAVAGQAVVQGLRGLATQAFRRGGRAEAASSEPR